MAVAGAETMHRRHASTEQLGERPGGTASRSKGHRRRQRGSESATTLEVGRCHCFCLQALEVGRCVWFRGLERERERLKQIKSLEVGSEGDMMGRGLA